MNEPFSPDCPGQLGDFQILRELGRGGMGTVYESLQVSLHRKVALKILSGGLGLTTAAVARFQREAEATAKLHHSNIVSVYSTGEDRGTHYYAMELVEGPSLEHVIKHMRQECASEDKNTVIAAGGVDNLEAELPAWVTDTIAYEKAGSGVGTSSITSDSSLESSPKYAIGATWKTHGLLRIIHLLRICGFRGDGCVGSSLRMVMPQWRP